MKTLNPRQCAINTTSEMSVYDSNTNGYSASKSQEKDYTQWENFFLLQQTPQLLALMTTLRNRDTKREEFVFYADRVIRLLIEEALNQLPVEEISVQTPLDTTYEGCKFVGKLCGVSIIRAGEAMESGLLAVCRGCRIGKILITRDETTALPTFHYKKLPEDIGKRHVLLLDPMCATAGTALSAIEELKESGANLNKIIFVNIVATASAINKIYSKYSQIKIVTAAIDHKLDNRKFILPGMGDFGDRYHSTD